MLVTRRRDGPTHQRKRSHFTEPITEMSGSQKVNSNVTTQLFAGVRLIEITHPFRFRIAPISVWVSSLTVSGVQRHVRLGSLAGLSRPYRMNANPHVVHFGMKHLSYGMWTTIHGRTGPSRVFEISAPYLFFVLCHSNFMAILV
jgi:hypothetical protein